MVLYEFFCQFLVCAFAPQMSEHWSLPMIRANMGFSFQLHFGCERFLQRHHLQDYEEKQKTAAIGDS